MNWPLCNETTCFASVRGGRDISDHHHTKTHLPQIYPVPIKAYLLDGMSTVSGATLILTLAGQKGIVDVKEDGDNLW